MLPITAHLCVLVPAPLFLYMVLYLHQFSAVVYIKKIGTETAIYIGSNKVQM